MAAEWDQRTGGGVKVSQQADLAEWRTTGGIQYIQPTGGVTCTAGTTGAASRYLRHPRLLDPVTAADMLQCVSLCRAGGYASVSGRSTRAVRKPQQRTPTHAQAVPEQPSRRSALAAAAALLAVPPRSALAAADGANDAVAAAEWTRYTRSTRARFETSISSATRAYTFEVPASWKQETVSLNDGKLYGTDLRLLDKSQGQLAVSLLPYVGRDSLADVGTPEQALQTFVELVGAFWERNGFGVDGGLAGKVLTARAETHDGLTYYTYETATHNLLSSTVCDGQLYVLTVSSASERQWRTSEAALRRIAASFRVPP